MATMRLAAVLALYAPLAPGSFELSASTPLTNNCAADPFQVATTWLHWFRLLVPPVRSQPSPEPLPLYIRKFQPVSATRWKNTHPERLPDATRLDTGASSLSDAVGFAQNSIVKGLALAGLSAELNGTVVLVPATPS